MKNSNKQHLGEKIEKNGDESPSQLNEGLVKQDVTDILSMSGVHSGEIPNDLMLALETFAKYNLNGNDLTKRIHDLGLTTLQSMVLEQVSNSTPITNGQEGEIYLVTDEKGKDFLVAKKRYHEGGKKEFDNQKAIFDIANEHDCGVRVPIPVDYFVKDKDEYIVMEYINGKTLYTLILEQIVDEIILDFNNIGNGRLKDELTRYREENTVDGNINLENDTHAEVVLIGLLNMLFQYKAIKDNPRTISHNINSSIISSPIVEKYYNKYYDKIKVFDKEKGNELGKKIKNMLDFMHDKGFYHRDLGGNTRNIMFKEEDGETIPYLIDFGHSITGATGSEVYESHFDGGSYVDDNYIVTKIRHLSGEKKARQVNESLNDSKNIIDMGNRNGLDIQKQDIEFCEKMKNVFKPHILIDDFISGNSQRYNWWINFKDKTDEQINANKEGKKRLFILISILSPEDKEKLSSKINEILETNPRKNTKKYYYANLFGEYINISNK